jgi:hypothetical protein
MAQHLQQLLLPFTWAHALPPPDAPGEMLKKLMERLLSHFPTLCREKAENEDFLK